MKSSKVSRFSLKQIILGVVIAGYLGLILGGLSVVIKALINGEFTNASFGILG
jgi:hypothetical protein